MNSLQLENKHSEKRGHRQFLPDVLPLYRKCFIPKWCFENGNRISETLEAILSYHFQTGPPYSV